MSEYEYTNETFDVQKQRQFISEKYSKDQLELHSLNLKKDESLCSEGNFINQTLCCEINDQGVIKMTENFNQNEQETKNEQSQMSTYLHQIQTHQQNKISEIDDTDMDYIPHDKNLDNLSMQNQPKNSPKENLYLDKSQKRSLFLNSESSKIIQLTSFRSKKTSKRRSCNEIEDTKFYYNKTPSGRRIYIKNPKIRQSINDKSDIWVQLGQNWIQNKLESFYEDYLENKFNSIPLFNPQHTACFIMNILFSSINYFLYIIYSCVLVYQVEMPHQNKLFTALILFWVIEILKKLNTSMYTNVNIIKNRSIIFIFYCKKEAIFDLLAFTVFLPVQQNTKLDIVIRVISYAKLINVIQELNKIEKQFCVIIQKFYYIQLIKLIFQVFLIAHIIACLWYLIGQIELFILFNESTWYDDSIGSDGVWWKLYLSSFYWALTLMTTGSNEANTPLQTFFTSIIMLFTTIIFGYFINIIGVILSENDETEENKRKDVNIINNYMRKRNISKKLQGVINLDLEYFYKHNYKKQEEENQQVLSKISFHLSEQLQSEYYGSIINKIEVIKKHFGNETIEKISLCCEEQFFLPDQIISYENDKEDFSLMYVLEGTSKYNYQIILLNNILLFLKVELSRSISDQSKVSKKLVQIGKDSIFGQLSFFTGYINQAQAQAKTFTTILKISRNKFLDIIRNDEKEFQKFCQIKDSILNYKNYEAIQQKCFICQKYTHNISDCPIVHFDKDEAYSKVRYYEKIQQKRFYTFRKNVKSKNNIKNASMCVYDQQYRSHYFIPVSYITINSKNEFYQEEIDSEKKSIIVLEDSKQRYNIVPQPEQQLQQFEQGFAFITQEEMPKPKVTFEPANLPKSILYDSYNNPKSNLNDSFLNPKSNLHDSQKNFSKANTNNSDFHNAQNNIITHVESSFSQRTIQENKENQDDEFKINSSISNVITTLQQLMQQINTQAMKSKQKRNEIKAEVSKKSINSDDEKKKGDQLYDNDINQILWYFDMQKDFEYYFPYGNCSNRIANNNRLVRKKTRKFKTKGKLDLK